MKSMKEKTVSEDKYKQVAIMKLVSKMEIKLTMPEDVIVKQEDAPEVASISAEDKEDNEKKDAAKKSQAASMFFIAKGSCLVSVKTRNIFSVNQSEV